jgi:hypothetical protein
MSKSKGRFTYSFFESVRKRDYAHAIRIDFTKDFYGAQSPFEHALLFFVNRGYWANAGACAAADALFRVDIVRSVALKDGFDWAFGLTSAAGNTIRIDFIRHDYTSKAFSNVL